MVKRFERQEIMARLKAEIDEGRALFDAFAGTGISAKFAEVGGADMITTHILARFRMAGLSSMAGYLSIADANAVTLELGKRDIIPRSTQLSHNSPHRWKLPENPGRNGTDFR